MKEEIKNGELGGIEEDRGLIDLTKDFKPGDQYETENGRKVEIYREWNEVNDVPEKGKILFCGEILRKGAITSGGSVRGLYERWYKDGTNISDPGLNLKKKLEGEEKIQKI